MHASSLANMQSFHDEFLASKRDQTLQVLDIGSMDVNGTYRSILDSPNWNYIGTDMEPGNGVDLVFKKPYSWREVKSNSVDVLVSGQAFEHIEYFWITILEVFRVLKPGGICCIIAPAGGYEHKYPVDCWRFYPDGFTAMAKFAQLEVLKVETHWESQGYDDGSELWMDSVLVARKPVFSTWIKLKSEIKCYLQHKLMSLSIN
ncbi:methyltransferase domain-containing protein [Gimesia aquarii]|uniref:Methyltransferase domain protein n=1 Tax=Gimesia aquarii TaxID=2527964 RepID=A0A517X0F0_9PLAN|nr:methyltransferase domain-containing protein [Gimesia aquarii]QDU10964.1 Methyltransferase domain protein [Gimesia aquarii]